MVSPTQGFKLGIPRNDYRKMLSVLCHQEKTRIRKRRWLMELMDTKHEDYQKKLKMPKYMLESFIRDDDVSFHNIKSYMETGSMSFSENQQKHHVVQNYLQLLDMYKTDPAVFFKTLFSALNNLKPDVLDRVTQIVTGSKIGSERTRVAMKRVVEENLPEILLQADFQNNFHSKTVKQLSEIFRDPMSFRNTHLMLITPVTTSLRTSITEILEGLDDIPSQVLLAMDRKLKGVIVVPQLPINFKFKKELLIKRVRMVFSKTLLALDEGDELPKRLAKALSAISLYKKQAARRDDIPTTEFFPFTPQTVSLQNDILKAIWSLPKLKNGELKRLRLLVDPDAKLPWKTFRVAINKYLVEYLFEIDEIDIPKSLLRVLAFVNRKSRRQLDFCKRQNIDEELGAVLNISGQLRQILWDSFQDHDIESYMEGFGTEEEDDGNDDIVIDGTGKCSCCCEPGILQSHGHGPCLHVKEEIGETEHIVPFVSVTDKKCAPHVLKETSSMTDTNKYAVKLEHSAGLNGCQSCPRSLINSGFQGTPCKIDDSSGNGYGSIQNICDETSLLAHRLIGRVVEKFQEAKTSRNSDGQGPAFLIQAVDEILPSFPNSDLERVKKLMGFP